MEESKQGAAASDPKPISLNFTRTLFRAILGMAVGAIFLWLVLRGIEIDDVILLLLGAGGIFIGFAIVLIVFGRKQTLPLPDRWAKISAKIRYFQDGVSVFRDGGLLPVFSLSVCVWLLEAASLWCIFSAIGVSLGFGGLAFVTSVATLATLLPSSPAYVGTYQYAFVFALGLLGHGAVEAVAASMAAQVLLLGSVTVVGLALHIAHKFRSAMFIRQGRPSASGDITKVSHRI